MIIRKKSTKKIQEFLVKLEKIIRPGRQVANTFQGRLSFDFINQTLEVRKSSSPETIIKRIECIFQPNRKLQEVVVPYFSTFFKMISTKEPFIYKGVSFNPLITTFGENVNLLDSYSWVKKSKIKGIIFDASLYAIINATKQPPVEIFSSRAAEKTVEFLKNKKEHYLEIKEGAKIRERYLRAIAVSLFVPHEAPLVISAEEIWESKKYIECLQKAIEFCVRTLEEEKKIEIIKYANYERYNTEFQRWYTILVLAEVLYLNQIYGVNIKLGPTSESNFDALINDFMKKMGIPFGFIWYNREIEKQLAYPERLFFKNTEAEIRKKLSTNFLLAEWIKEIVEPFAIKDEDVVTTTLSIIQKVNKVAKKELPRTNTEGGFFIEFPPGECD